MARIPKYASTKAYGDCEGPFGFPMVSSVASEVNTLMKDVSDECKKLGYRRTVKVPSKTEFVEGERADISVITTDTVDRDFEIIDPKGLDWSQFHKSPTVTWAHRYDQLPVGRSIWAKRTKTDGINGWTAKTLYTERPPEWPSDAWFPDAVWYMVKNKTLNGKSIGFLPIEVKAVRDTPFKNHEHAERIGFVYTKALVLEYAVAPVQSNPDALVQQVPKAKLEGLVIPKHMLANMGLLIFDGEAFEETVELEDVVTDITKQLEVIATKRNYHTVDEFTAKTKHAFAELASPEHLKTLINDVMRSITGKV